MTARESVTVQDISRRLAQQAESLCRELLPNGHKEGPEWRVGSVQGEAGNSLGVRLDTYSNNGKHPDTV